MKFEFDVYKLNVYLSKCLPRLMTDHKFKYVKIRQFITKDETSGLSMTELVEYHPTEMKI